MARKKVQEGHLGDMAMKAEMDHEVQMARSDLFKIAKYAVELHDMLKSVSEAEGIEGWQQSKITKAADYLGSVYHSMDYEMNVNESEQLDEFGGLGKMAALGARLGKAAKNASTNIKKTSRAADRGIKTARFNMTANEVYRQGANLQKMIADNPNRIEKSLRSSNITLDGVNDLIDRAIDFGRGARNTSGHSRRDLEILLKDGNKMIKDLIKVQNKTVGDEVLRTIIAFLGGVLIVVSQEFKKNDKQGPGVQEAKKANKDYDGDGKIESSEDEWRDSRNNAIQKAQSKSANESMLRQINMAIGYHDGTVGKANMSIKAFELAEMHYNDLTTLKADFERRVTNEAKKKKPDADGDGVPDWADKKPGKDDNAEKTNEAEVATTCWDGYAPGAQSGVKTKAGTGKNKGKRVNNCEKK